MTFKWGRLKEIEFAEAVALLLRAQWRDRGAMEAYAPDGRGGDGGVDFFVRAADGEVIIYQFKFFPDGLFKASASSRKRHLRDSFAQAQRHEPDRWVFVVPCQLTPGERRFVEELAEGTSVTVEVLDLVGLNELLARHDKVRRYVERDPVLEAVAEYQLDSGVIADADDLLARARHLGKRSADMDPYWEPVVSVDGDNVTISARPKYPDSTEKSPFVVEMVLDEEDATDEDRAAFQRSVGFGVGEPATMPVVVRKESGPSFVDMDGPGTVTLGFDKRPRLDDQFSVRLLSRDGVVLGVHDGTVTHVGSGFLGITVELTFYGGLTVAFLLPRDGSAPGRAEMKLETGGLMIADAADALALRREICRDVDRIEILREGKVASGLKLDQFEDPADAALDAFDEFAGDLAFLERRGRGRRRMPSQFTDRDRLLARLARLALEGRCVVVPDFLHVNARVDEQLTDEEHDGFREMVSSPHAYRVERRSFEFVVGGVQTDLGPVVLYSPNVGVAEPDRLLALLDGEAGDRRLTFVPDSTEPWRLVCLSVWDSSARLVPVPWGAIGVAEHPALDLIVASAATS